MSLPRFLKGLQRKPSSAQPSIPSHPSDHNLSDASTASSASGPKDAFGFPLPVTTVITTIKPIPASMLTSTGSSPCSSPYPGPMDIVILPVSTESSSNSNRKGSGSIGGYSRNSSHSGRFASTHTTNRSSQSSSQSSMRLSQDKDDSVLLNSSLSTSCPQLTLPPLSVPPVPSPALNSINSIPVPTANKATLSSPSSNAGTTIVGFDIITTTLTEDQDESDGDIAANQTQDTTGAVGGARNRQSKGLHHHDNLYHITPVKGNRSRSNAVAMLPGTGTTIISAANYSYPNPPAAGPTAGSIPSLGSAADPEPIRTLRQDSICPSSRMQERTAGSGSVCNIASSTSTATELIHSGTSNDPQQSSASLSSISSTRSRSLTSPHDAAATDRPASILIKPKSILRSRSCSGSQRRLQSELSQPQPQPQDSITSVLPSPPTTVRISASSDRSLVYQPSLYLHQDPMAEGGGEGHVIAMDTGTRSRTGGIHSQRRPSTSSRGSGNVQSADIISSAAPSPDPSHIHIRPRMPPTPSSTQGLASLGLDHEDHSHEHGHLVEPFTSSLLSHHRLSFPSLNEYKTLALSTSPSPPTTPPQSDTSLTIKSPRAAKSKNKLRQEPQIGAAMGIRRTSLPKSTNGPVLEYHSAASATEGPSSTDHEPVVGDISPPTRRREHSIASSSGHSISHIYPRPILKDTSSRDKLQRESWMSEPPGITISGSHTSGSIRSTSALQSSPVAPPKSLARGNSGKRQTKLSRVSNLDHDQDALTPRTRHGATGYGPDYRPRRQSGGPGHLLYAVDASSSGPDFESEDYDDSDVDDMHHRSKHLQEQYSLLQKSHLANAGPNFTTAGNLMAGDDVPYFAKQRQRKSLGDELNVPPVPEKSMQRKRVSTMGSATLPPVSSALASASLSANNSATSSSDIPPFITHVSSQKQKDRRPYGSIGANSLSFEPLFALRESGVKTGKGDGQQVGRPKDSAASRFSAVSDADWYTALLTVDPNQHGVSILDLSKRELTEIPSDMPTTITHLRLAYNMIRIFAPIASLTCLNHLQVLDLCDNKLEILPPEIGLLTKLRELYLSNNKLWKLPDNIQKMARLEVLDIRNNQLYLLNPAVGRLKALRQLDVRNNLLKSLPSALCLLSSTLSVLLVDGNQFVQPFSELVQSLTIENKDSTTYDLKGFLSDDPYSDHDTRNVNSTTVKAAYDYEPWRRSIMPSQRRAATLTKRRSHGDIMLLMGLQKKDEIESETGAVDQEHKSHMASLSSGTHIAASLSAEDTGGRRERSVSTSTVSPAEFASSSAHSNSSGLSFNKFLKSIRKSSKTSLKDTPPASIKSEAAAKRISLGSEVDPLGDVDSDIHDGESRPSSKGSISAAGGSYGRRTTPSGINQWVRDRFHKRTNSSDMGTLSDAHGSMSSLNTYAFDGSDAQQVRDSGYGGIGSATGSQLNPSLGSTPDLSQTLLHGRGSSVLDNRFQNKSTGHLPYGSPLSSRDTQLSSSFDPAQRKERDYRYSSMSAESHLTQGTELESEYGEIDTIIAQQHQLQQQQHRLSSVHSPTTPLPSSPTASRGSILMLGGSSWNAANPRYSQSAASIKPLMQYLRDLHDLDPDSSEWEEVYAWRRVWNTERSTTIGHGGATDESNTEETSEHAEKQVKDEELRIAKLQAQASRRRRIVDEIIATERTYVEGLKGLVEIYLTPALQVMPPGDHKAVFSNAQAIYTFHANHFLPELEKSYRVTSSSNQQQQQPSTMVHGVTSPMSPVPTSSSSLMSSLSAPSSAISSSVNRAARQNSNVGQTPGVSATSSQQEQTAAATIATNAANSQDSLSGGCDFGSVEQSTTSSATSVTTNQSIESTIKTAIEDRIGRVFAEHVAYMKMYSFYINNFDNALRVLQAQLTQAKHKKKMKEFLRRCAKHPNHTQLALQGYLLLPVQRIPRYKLLLQDLLENTWPDHVDYQDIATALEKISSRADEMNERKRQYENHEKVLLIQNRIIGQYRTPLVQPHRKVVREGMLHLIRVVTRNVSMGIEKAVSASNPSVPQVGDLTVHHLSEETVERPYLFILFNDIMIQCNQVMGKVVGGAGGASGSGAGGLSSGLTVNGLGTSSGATGSGSANADAGAKNLELCRVLQLESRLHPAEVLGQDVLRVVDDSMILYLTGDKDVIQAWKEDINSRW